MLDFSSDPYIADNQMKALIFCLVAFAYIDTEFDPAEKKFIQDYIRQLVQHRAEQILDQDEAYGATAENWAQHFLGVLEEVDQSIQQHFTESIARGESVEQYVMSRLKLGCFELLERFDEAKQNGIIETVEQLMHADGVVHPAEQTFRDELVALVRKPIEDEPTEISPMAPGSLVVDEPRHQDARMLNHPFLSASEWDYANKPAVFAQQCDGDLELASKVMEILERQRAAGRGRLASAKDFTAFRDSPPFLDGYVYVLPPMADQDVELLVIGDLHGCYSCLKAALLQADFFRKVQAYRQDPMRHPAPYLVLLGDYIDRGRYSFNGTLRAVMQLVTKMPDRVFMLRGNHEYYVEINGRVLAPVRPCEAMDSISDLAETEVFVRYMKLFESLPHALVFDQLLFVHAGLPRADTLEEKWQGLETLNDQEIRFQMLWSDASETDVVPVELQQQSARFAFGRRQFHQFMARLGCHTMIRGHERVVEGFRKNYDDPEGALLTVFSAGGRTNADLPAKSTYREVTPMALSIHWSQGTSTVTPLLLDYARYNRPEYNAFFRSKAG